MLHSVNTRFDGVEELTQEHADLTPDAAGDAIVQVSLAETNRRLRERLAAADCGRWLQALPSCLPGTELPFATGGFPFVSSPELEAQCLSTFPVWPDGHPQRVQPA